MSPDKLFKLEAAGNDFILIPREPRANEGPALAERLCRRHFSVGADGLLFAWPQKPAAPRQIEQDWRWQFFNADGSEAAFCGNAARALTKWFARRFKGETEFAWQATKTRVAARLDAEQAAEASWDIEARRQTPSEALLGLAKSAAGASFESAWLVEAGVPHFVVITRSPIDAALRREHAPHMRRHASLGAPGANVTFVARSNLEAVTFERGVEGETLACGSGAIAAFVALAVKGTLELKFPGGALRVREDSGRLWLGGSAHVVFEAELVDGA